MNNGASEAQRLTTGIDGFTRRTLFTLQPAEWVLVIVCACYMMGTGILTLVRLVNVLLTDPTHPDFTFALLILVNTVFCGFYLVNGILRERQHEIWALVGAMVIIMGYCYIEYFVNFNGRNTVKLLRLIFGTVFSVIGIYLCWRVAARFGYLEFRIIGASEILQNMYRQCEIFRSLLTFDLQLSLSLLVLSILNGTKFNTETWLILSLGTIFALLYYILAFQSIKLESYPITLAVVVLSLASPAFVAYRIEKIVKLVLENWEKHKAHNHVFLYVTLTVGAIALIVRGFLLTELYKCFSNFGKGLRDRLFTSSAAAAPRPRPTYGSASTTLQSTTSPRRV